MKSVQWNQLVIYNFIYGLKQLGRKLEEKKRFGVVFFKEPLMYFELSDKKMWLSVCFNSDTKSTLLLQTPMIWTRTWPGWRLWVSPAVCRWSALTPSVLWRPLCSTQTPAPSSSPDLWSGPTAAPRLRPIPTQRRTLTTCQVSWWRSWLGLRNAS